MDGLRVAMVARPQEHYSLLLYRNAMVRCRAGDFDWDKTAAQHAELFRAIARRWRRHSARES
ncbi:MAG: hypothetical protein HY848_22980 [Betaproteobacteria bacterium]|nr:hypothetical protein [Betaproteobacteria bacterium]